MAARRVRTSTRRRTWIATSTYPSKPLSASRSSAAPGSALYGGNAIFGVVNLVTKDGADLNGGMARIEGGTQDTARVAALYGTKTQSGLDIIGGFSGFMTQGNGDIIYDGVHDADHDYGHVRDSSSEGAYSGFLKLRMGEFTATLDMQRRDRDASTAPYLTVFQNPGSIEEDRANITLKYDHTIDQNQSIHAMLYYGHYAADQPQYYANDPATPQNPFYRYVSVAGNDWIGQELHYDWQVNSKLHLLLGGDATESLYTYQRDSDSINGSWLSTSNSYAACGAFAEAEYKATEWLTLVGGGRIDYVQRIDTQLSPRLAMLISPDNADVIKAMYGRAFRAPNLYERFYTIPDFNVGNDKLRPEIVDTYELVWEREFASGWRTSLGGYFWSMHDSLNDVVLNTGELQTQNGGTVQSPRNRSRSPTQLGGRWKLPRLRHRQSDPGPTTGTSSPTRRAGRSAHR